MKPKIFLTGPTSYLGTKFIELYGSKYEVLGVSRNDATNPIDLLDFETVKQAYNQFQPDYIVHLAADLGRDATTSEQITKTNPAILANLIGLAKPDHTPFIFTSTEAVYGGKENGGYVETDSYQPRSPYGDSKVESEKLLIGSGLPYLITRGHRYVGVSHNFHSPKQFPDTLKALKNGEEVHLDSKKIFTPMLINNGCDIIDHYIEHDNDKQVLVNIGVGKATTYYGFVMDVAKGIGLQTNLIHPDGNEAGWPANSSLDISKLEELGYPTFDYGDTIQAIKEDYDIG